MLESLYQAIYGVPIGFLLLAAAVALFVAFVIDLCCKDNSKIIIGAIGLIIAFIIILYSTMLRRAETDVTPILTPGYSLSKALWNREYLRMVLMNIALFVPYGVFFPMAFAKRRVSSVIKYALISGFMITFLIELLQYMFYLGCAETDDVICNFLGVIIGLIPYILACIIKRGTRRKQ